ncbi:tyrosine-type recombinase/integrase [Novosphingobium huizhouense]|uniref:tyrosine-type recombinase/integrase n=1 Tax=Novosphingobium huizhouense TaxID=2866625 RepID=UPI003850620B
MPIYPDKKNGQPTGRYRVEVQANGQRMRGRASSLSDAKRLELTFLDQLEGREAATPSPVPAASPPTPKPSCLSFGEAAKRARGILWVGQATEAESFLKLDRIVGIVGPKLPLDDFDAVAADDLLATLSARGITPGTINRYLSCLSAFLRFCKKRNFRTAPPLELEWRDEDEGRIRWLSYEEEARLMELLPGPIATVVYVAIRTGLRASELIGLKPDQVQPRWVHLWKTKNGSPRSVPISDDLYRVLAPLVRTMPSYPQVYRAWEAARTKMGLRSDKTFVFHACRHTYATRAVQAGVNIRVLQKLMGHKTIQTTLRYAHVDDKTLADAALSALAFHEALMPPKGGGFGAAIDPVVASTDSRKLRNFRVLVSVGVPPRRSANPFTPVRFRLGPPTLPTSESDRPRGGLRKARTGLAPARHTPNHPAANPDLCALGKRNEPARPARAPLPGAARRRAVNALASGRRGRCFPHGAALVGRGARIPCDGSRAASGP